ncbi:MAG: TonB-dependent receptor [Flavobacteriales bacterium]|nr:TonB-dependent receptor [Flavobacteriales bacterium]
MPKFYLILILLTPCFCFAQLGKLKGKLVDDLGYELIGSDIYLDSNMVATTNNSGEYEIEAEAGMHTVTIKSFGFTDVTIQIEFKAGETLTHDISYKEDKNLIDEVVVSAGKFEQKLSELTVSMAILKPDLLENRNTISCEEILEQVPGVNMQEDQISIRGGSGFSYGAGSRVLLLVDDMPMLAGDANDIKWSSLPIENLEQIEIIKGASSVLYGSSALNGVVHIRTGFPKIKPRTKVRIFTGFYDTPYSDYKGTSLSGTGDTILRRKDQRWWSEPQYYTGINFFHSRRIKENLDLTFGGAGFKDLGYRKGEFEERVRFNTNLRYRSKKIDGLSVGLNFNAQAQRGSLFFIWQDADSVLIPQGGTDSATTTLSDFNSYRVNVDPYITYFSKRGYKHSLRTRWYNTTNINNTNQGSYANTFYGEYQFAKRNKDKAYNFTTGITGMYTNVRSQLYNDHNSNNIAVYAQFDKKYFDKLNISAGVRAEYFRIDTSITRSTFTVGNAKLPVQPVFRAGAAYELGKFTFLRASYGQGYRFPTIAEKFVATSVSLLNIFPSPNVTSETGWSAEIGIKQGFKVRKFKGYVDVAGFMTSYQNMMEFKFGVYHPNGDPYVSGPGIPPPTFANFGAQSTNVQDAQISGVDIQVVGKGDISDDFGIAIFAGYTYMNPVTINPTADYLASFSDSNSTMLKYRFRHLVKIDIQFDYKKWSLGMSTRHNSFTENIDYQFQYPIVGNIAILPGMDDYRKIHNKGDWIFDSRISYKISDHIKGALVIKNVLNREYMSRPGDVMPPRTYAFQFSFNF